MRKVADPSPAAIGIGGFKDDKARYAPIASGVNGSSNQVGVYWENASARSYAVL